MRTPQSREELLTHLKEQLQFLEMSAKLYDEGFLIEAKRLAVTMRVLLHDTRNSKSLLNTLGIRDSLNYYDVVGPVDEEETIAFIGASMGINSNGSMCYFPRETPASIKVSFDQWWNGILILSKPKGIKFTRKEIILSIADMDGGAHVDPTLEEKYAQLSRNNGFGWQGSDFENGPELPLVRQTARELYLTLCEQMPK